MRVIKPMKPQEALEIVMKNISFSMYESREMMKTQTNSKLVRSIRVFEKLSSKATPMKPTNHHCPRCDGWNIISEEWGTQYNHCPDCGQAIEWREK